MLFLGTTAMRRVNKNRSVNFTGERFCYFGFLYELEIVIVFFSNVVLLLYIIHLGNLNC